MRQPVSIVGSGPSAGPLPSRPAIPSGDRSTYPSDEGLAIRPRVGTGFRLQWEPVQDAHVLLYPEGMVKLNPSAGEIMKRCDGQRSLAAIVAELEAAFNVQGLADDVLAFVQMAGAQRWLTWA